MCMCMGVRVVVVVVCMGVRVVVVLGSACVGVCVVVVLGCRAVGCAWGGGQGLATDAQGPRLSDPIAP